MTVALAREVASQVAALDGVVAVALGGSAGRTTSHYQPGHPHGFHGHSYAGFVHHNLVLHDPAGALAARRAPTSPRCCSPRTGGGS